MGGLGFGGLVDYATNATLALIQAAAEAILNAMPARDPRGRVISSSTDFGGRLSVATRTLVARGYMVEAASIVHFSKFEALGGTVAYNSTDGTYDVSTTTTSGSAAIDIHNKPIHYREGFPAGALISLRLSTTGATNNRKEWGLVAGKATSVAAILAADAAGFYFENGVLGIFYRTSLTGTYGGTPNNTTQVPQSSWTDKLDGTGRSGLTLMAATDLLNEFLFAVEFVWLGAKGIQFFVAGHLVYEIDFSAPGFRTTKPYWRIPHPRPYTLNASINSTGGASAASDASTLSRNCLVGYVDTTEEPIAYPFWAQRTSGITLNPSGTAFPVMAIRISSTAKARILIPLLAEVRVTSQNTELAAYLGRDTTDIVVTGGAWTTPPNNPDTKAEYNITATSVTINAGAQRVPMGAFIELDVGATAGTAVLDFREFMLEEHRWVGINGDGVQLIFVVTATAQAGVNAVATIRQLLGKEFG